MIDEKKLIAEMQEAYKEQMNYDTTADWFRGFDRARAIVEQQPKVMEWIPVSERLPNKYMHCFVTRKNKYLDGFDADVREDVWIELEGEWGWHSQFEGLTEDIVAWMSLPEPYKGRS